MSGRDNKGRLAAEESAPGPRPIPQLALHRAEDVRNLYRLILPAACRYEDLLNDNAAKVTVALGPLLTRGDVIEVIDEAGTIFAQLLLAEHVPGRHVQFVEINKCQLSGEPVDNMEGNGGYRVAWGGWVKRFCVVRPVGGIARDGMRTREEAETEAHQRNLPQYQRQTLA